MDTFEEIGQRIDEELARLKKYVEKDLGPNAEKCTARFLREVSEKLTDAAGWLEARRAERAGEASKGASSGSVS